MINAPEPEYVPEESLLSDTDKSKENPGNRAKLGHSVREFHHLSQSDLG